jgi:hypothetical protein
MNAIGDEKQRQRQRGKRKGKRKGNKKTEKGGKDNKKLKHKKGDKV